MGEVEFPEITDEIRDVLAKETCHCGRNFKGKTVVGYEHDGGWNTKRGRYWLYVVCDCGYQMSLWKIGVPQSRDFSNMA